MGTRPCERSAGRASGGCEGHAGPVGALTFASIYVDPPFSFLPRSPSPGSVSTALLPFPHSEGTASLSGHMPRTAVLTSAFSVTSQCLHQAATQEPPLHTQLLPCSPPALTSVVPALGEEGVG